MSSDAATTTDVSTIPKPITPYRQIRADYDAETIIVYQAYSSAIASAAVKHQKLNASPSFIMERMTWIKPSWAWVLYRSGYSYKDARQTNILALTMTHEAFKGLLRRAVLTHGPEGGKRDLKEADVRVQWDPERSIRLGKLDYRSIQIGIPRPLVPEWVEGIVKIENVTDRARELKRVLDEDDEREVTLEELIERGLVPVEREFKVDADLRKILVMGDEEG